MIGDPGSVCCSELFSSKREVEIGAKPAGGSVLCTGIRLAIASCAPAALSGACLRTTITLPFGNRYVPCCEAVCKSIRNPSNVVYSGALLLGCLWPVCDGTRTVCVIGSCFVTPSACPIVSAGLPIDPRPGDGTLTAKLRGIV